MDCGILPTELWHVICAKLIFTDLASMRLVNRGLAELAAEYLVREVHFHTSDISFSRLENIANHPLLRKNVKTLIFEGSILADAGCVHSYSEHYDLDHHSDEKPKQPKSSATDRTFRLYERNMVKFNREIERKYQSYRTKYEKQQNFIAEPPVHRLAESVDKFPALQEIQLRTDARCRHSLSERFMQEFGRDCAVPMEPDPTHTKWQLQHMLLPNGRPKKSLRSLQALTISSNFFSDAIPPPLMVAAFESLRRIRLEFRLDRTDFVNLISPSMKDPYRAIAKGYLRNALTAARELQALTINFDPRGINGPAIDLDHVMGSSTWPQLRELDIDFMSCTEAKFLEILKRQPSLKELEIAFIHLTDSDWIEMLTKMRKELHLDNLWCAGSLEDEVRIWPMDLLDYEAWQDGIRVELAMLINNYVTDESMLKDYDLDEEEFDLTAHPLLDVDEQFWEEGELLLEFGPVDDSDMSGLDSDSDGHTSETEDSDLASLMSMDIDED